jgi:hypothetical protein
MWQCDRLPSLHVHLYALSGKDKTVSPMHCLESFHMEHRHAGIHDKYTTSTQQIHHDYIMKYNDYKLQREYVMNTLL